MTCGTEMIMAPANQVNDTQSDVPSSQGRIAQVSLTVSDLDRVATFYRTIIGLQPISLSGEMARLGTANGTVLLTLVRNGAATRPDATAPGLFHTAFLLPTRRDLANWLSHAMALGVRIEGASDHLVSEAIYLSDPEGNGVEIYADRPRAGWPMDGAMIRMATLALDGPSLMHEADSPPSPWHFPADGCIGHVHLKVHDLGLAERFYTAEAGLTVMARYPGAVFMGWDGYHHHVAVNIWNSRQTRRPLTGLDVERHETGLLRVDLHRVVPGQAVHAGGISLPDPSGNRLLMLPS